MSTKSERDKFKDHFDGIINTIFWVKEHWLVFVVMGSIWTTCFGAILHFALIPAAKPVVTPIIENMWRKQVAPYDSTVTNFEDRLKNLESQVFPEAN